MALNLNLDKSLGVVAVILGAIISLTVLAGFIAPMFTATHTVTDAFNNASTGSAQANILVHSLAFVIPIAIVVGLIGLVLLASKLHGK